MYRVYCLHTLALLITVAAFAACGDDDDGADAHVFDATLSGDAAADIDGSATADASDIDATGIDASDIDSGPTADAPPVTTDLRINEFVLDNAGSDTDEFIEVKGTPNTDYSDFMLLEIDGDNFNDGTGRGMILNAIAVGATDSNGYFLPTIANNTFQNGTQTILLVRNFNASGGLDIDTDDDGVIDNPAWDGLVDGVAIFDNRPASDNTDRTYAGAVFLTKVWAAGNEPVAFGGASRIPNGVDTDSPDDWTSNTPAFDNAGIASGEANNTPGADNTVEP